VASALIVGSFFVSAFRDLRSETYRWFDDNAGAWPWPSATRRRKPSPYFDYKAIEATAREAAADDKDLLYVSVAFGDGMKERRDAGSGGYRPLPHL